ncbi:hypothetical protein AS4_17830 [Acinetobacter guillouiae]|nr:hypothetical protein AS4_17830 [Acinetobacter guillouiae]
MSIAASFLSCLYGSEPIDFATPAGLIFLSCLYGSERRFNFC